MEENHSKLFRPLSTELSIKREVKQRRLLKRSKRTTSCRVISFKSKTGFHNALMTGKEKFRTLVYCISFLLYLSKLLKSSKMYQVKAKSRVETQDEIENYFSNALCCQFLKLPPKKVSNASITILRRILSIPFEQRGVNEQNLLMKYLKRIQLTHEFPSYTQHQLSRVLHFESYGPKRIIVLEGHPSKHAYFIIHGSVLVNAKEKSVRDGSIFNMTVKVLEAGDSFGVQEVLYGLKRKTTVITRSHVELLTVNEKDFHNVLGPELFKRTNEALRYVTTVKSLQMFPMYLLSSDSQALSASYYRFSTVVMMYNNSHLSSKGPVVVVRQGGCRVIVKLSYPLPYGQSEQMDVGTLPQLPKSKSLLQSEKNPQRSTSRIFEIGRVEAGECFGLELLFNRPLCKIVLISRGAECILINRDFFIKKASPEVERFLTTKSGMYPEKSILDHAVNLHDKWISYRKDIIKELV